MNDFPPLMNWTRIPTKSLRDTALANARKAAEECARRRREREQVQAYLDSRMGPLPTRQA